jgi:histidine triad (HIT) family protein
MASIFSKIIAGEIPCYKVAEDEHHLAFLDVFPLAKGHVLVVPKKETDYIFDLNDKEMADLMVFASKVARSLKKAVPCTKVGIAVIGLEVPHVHVHLVPLKNVSDLDFSKPKLKIPDEEMTKIAASIIAQ